jgi:hypothetical protein
MKEQLEKQRLELEEKKRRLLGLGSNSNLASPTSGGQAGDKSKQRPRGAFFNNSPVNSKQ